MNKTTISKRDFKTRFSSSLFDGMGKEKKRRNEGDLISFINTSIFLECSLQDHQHLESENGIEIEMKIPVAWTSAVKRNESSP